MGALDFVDAIGDATGYAPPEEMLGQDPFLGYEALLSALVDTKARIPAWVKSEFLDQFEPSYFIQLADGETEGGMMWRAMENYPKFIAMEPVLEGREPRRNWQMPPAPSMR